MVFHFDLRANNIEDSKELEKAQCAPEDDIALFKSFASEFKYAICATIYD